MMNLGEAEGVRSEWVNQKRLADRWILAELNDTIDEVTRALEEYRMNEVAQTLYRFFWDNFCDWYIELTKAVVSSKEETAETRAARSRIVYILETSLRLLHPLMPYITEEIWQRLPHEGESIMVAAWPEADRSREDRQARDEMQTLISVITKVRNIRSEMNIPPQSRLRLHLGTTDEGARRLINENADQIKRLARVEEITILDALPEMKSAARDIAAGHRDRRAARRLDRFRERARANYQRDRAQRERGARPRVAARQPFFCRPGPAGSRGADPRSATRNSRARSKS